MTTYNSIKTNLDKELNFIIQNLGTKHKMVKIYNKYMDLLLNNVKNNLIVCLYIENDYFEELHNNIVKIVNSKYANVFIINFKIYNFLIKNFAKEIKKGIDKY